MNEGVGEDTSRYLRTELLERIAHELRGPAGVTLGALDELEHALDAAQMEQHKLLLAMARRGARRVLRTAERLTRTAQLESGTTHVDRVPGDVRTIVKQAADDAALVEGRSSVRMALALPDEPCTAAVDGAWLTVAITELVAQSIRCARKSVEVSVEQALEGVRVIVSDDRLAAADMPAKRFVHLSDRRDAALSWPLVCDVAEAHHARLQCEVLRTATGSVSGHRVALQLPPA